MRLSVPDRNELLKAAVKAPDRESLARWIVSLVDAIDALPDGKSDAPAPPYVSPAGNGRMHAGSGIGEWAALGRGSAPPLSP